MPRTLSTAFLRGALAQETGICPVFLLTIEHEGLSVPIRVSSDPAERLRETAADVIYGTRSRGLEFLFYPFTLVLPSDEDEGPGAMTLQLDNVQRQLTAILRTIQGPPTVKTEIVLSDTPDVVEAVWPDFLLTQATYDATTIKGTLTVETLAREPYPALCFTPSYFPGLFK